MSAKSSGTHNQDKAHIRRPLREISCTGKKTSAAESAAFQSVQAWIEACPVKLSDSIKAKITQMIE